MERAAAEVARLLASCYDLLSAEAFDSEALSERSRKLCTLLVSLERHATPPNWRAKPKMHLFQELSGMTHPRPSSCWLYRDEDFGGSIAQLSPRRGGANRPHTAGKSVLARFAALYRVPRIA